MRRPGLSLALPAAFLAVFSGLTIAHAAQAGDEPAAGPAPKALAVCAVPATMPRTGKAPDGTSQGLDVAVARLVGQSLGRPVEFHWCASAGCSWGCLPERRCDVVAGQPQDTGPPRDVAWSVPYAGAGFGLVVRRGADGIGTLADLRGKRVGVVTGTVTISEKDHAVVRFKTREEALDGFRAAGLDAAFLDADFAAWYLHDRPALGLRVLTGYVPRERWNMALAVRAGDAELLVGINRALSQLTASGAIQKVYADHGVPFRPPFTGDAPPRAASDTWRRLVGRGELVVRMDPANLPYSSARDDRPGLDLELARALATRLNLKLRVGWLDTRSESAVGPLLEGECDLVFGESVNINAMAGDEEMAGRVLYSRPYYGTGYVLVLRKDGPRARSLAELKGDKAQRLGTEAGSVADYSLRRRGYLRRLYRNQLAVLKGLDDGDIDYAYLWANVGWTLHASPDLALEIVPGYVPEDHWNIAVAMRRGDDELRRHVDEALGALIKDGTVARTLARYHVPDYPPFEEPGRRPGADGDDVIRHGVGDRGAEPHMGKVQASSRPYSGLARVRSAGALVVGLDQNNLPFSTAHPTPAGFDYEVAGLIAEKLGVSLRVYWAYSAHDSYPSKLASKRLCDVILGVMPDDRFGERVLFSRPYYSASYRVVTRTGETIDPGRGVVAVEEGVAIRGLKARAVRSFPSTDAVLEAVATGRVGAGYVISTRGSWLAHKNWPGKLTFEPAPGPIDTFAIGAAVRESDRDLKDAIDQALDELAGSGQLTRVFARWGIQYEPAAARGTGDRP